MTITVYDAGPSSNADNKALGTSSYVRVAIFILRYKNLPYEIRPVKWEEIAATAKSIGAAPSETSPKERYTVPFIKDNETGVVLSDSGNIAEYLDKQYPDTPAVLPNNSKWIHKLVQGQIVQAVWGLYPIDIGVDLVSFWPEEYHSWYTRGSPEELKEAYKVAGENIDKLAGSLNGGAPYKGFVSGATPTFADFTLVAFVWPVRNYHGEDSDEWKQVRGWGKGWVGHVVDEITKATKADKI